MATFIALMRKERDSDYGVDFPDFPGCITAGSDLDEASACAREALAFHIAGMVEDGLDLPDPSTLEDIMADPHNRDAVAFLVHLPAPKVPSKRVNVMLPEDLLQAIDADAKKHGLSRSSFLAVAARDRLGMETPT